MALYLGSTKAKSIKLGNTSAALPPVGGSTPTEREFVRPDLTSNGTLGGSSFAVSASFEMPTGQAYKAVDSSTTSAWTTTNSDNMYYIVYNPNPLKVTKLGIKFSSLNKTTINSIYASNDNNNYTQIGITTSGTTTVDIILSNNNFYKYYKIRFNRRTGAGTLINVSNIAFTNAIEKVG